MKPRKAKRRPRKAAVTHEPRTKRSDDALREVSRWLQTQWLRHYLLFSGMASEADRLAMAQIGRFITAIKEARKWRR
jgi:hypothetical protein